jgi:hypothetical protein
MEQVLIHERESDQKHKKLHDMVDTLIQKYSTNEYVEGKLINFIENMLPAALENANNTFSQRSERKQQLTAHKDDFTQRFLQKHKYFYLPHAETFVQYDNLHFSIYSEDDIQHQILSTISLEHSLRVWKHKIKNNIMKQIKESSPLKCTPEEVTVQRVVSSLYPAFFETNHQAKYFLTVLGESLQQGLSNVEADATTTSEPCIYIISPQLKALIREINNQGYLLFGPLATFTNIKFKHYDHQYKYCRLLYGAKKGSTNAPPFMVKNILDILCVAAYFANRYGSADKFLAQCADPKLSEHALLLSKTTPLGLVQRFVDKTLTSCVGTNIEFKHMLFIWKKFLAENNIPNVLFYEALKQHLKQMYPYDAESDCFLHVTSTYLPVVASFIKFWENSIVEDDEEELELCELVGLFKTAVPKSASTTTELLILDLVRHFYPDTLIVEDKYFVNIKCAFMDKKKPIILALTYFKEQVLQTQQQAQQAQAQAQQAQAQAQQAEQQVQEQAQQAQAQAQQAEEQVQEQAQQEQAQQAQAEQVQQAQQAKLWQPLTLDDAYEVYVLLNAKNTLLPRRYFEKVARDSLGVYLDPDGIINALYWTT